MKILIADDHPPTREALRAALQRFDADAAALQAGTLDDALGIAARTPDLGLLLLDIDLADRGELHGT